MGDAVEIAEYDPAWPGAYERERAAIADALGGHV
ncbi:MAG: GrpB protein, partial [Dehalococcoidia bacterium]|nr:GrpB protein [Dehalococcoidia bacterium]